jgi:hypothetical protein
MNRRARRSGPFAAVRERVSRGSRGPGARQRMGTEKHDAPSSQETPPEEAGSSGAGEITGADAGHKERGTFTDARDTSGTGDMGPDRLTAEEEDAAQRN